MKTVISRDMEIGKYFVLAITILIILLLIGDWYSGGVYNLEKILPFVFFVILGLILTYFLHYAKKIEFDNEFMYVSSRKINERIPLHKVEKIKLTMSKVNNSSFWKISYKDDDNHVKSVRILPKWNDSFDKFKEKVKSRNPQVVIKNWSFSFDFDQ